MTNIKHSSHSSKILLLNIAIGLALFAGVIHWLKSEQSPIARAHIDLSKPNLQNLRTEHGKPEKGLLLTDKPYLFVNFWASWCQVCSKELSTLKLLEERLPGKLVKATGIATFDSIDNAQQSVKIKDLSMNLLIDPDGSTAALFDVTGLPHSFLLSQDGGILYAVRGPLSEEDIEAIKKILTRKKSSTVSH